MHPTHSDLYYLNERIDRLRAQLQQDFNTIYKQILELQRQIDALRHEKK